MRGLASRTFPVAVIALTAVIGTSGFSASSAPGTVPAATQPWTQVSANTGISTASAGLLRTSDGRLHLVYPSSDGTLGHSLHFSTIGARDVLLSTGPIVSMWKAVSSDPLLVPASGGRIRMIFTGADGTVGSPFNRGTMYSASAGQAGVTWALTTGSMSQSKVPGTDDAAAVETDDTPVAAWKAGTALHYHVGLDPANPATTPDVSVSAGASAKVLAPALARDKSGDIWAAWFNGSGLASQGYYVDQLLPATKPIVKAPSSGGAGLADNEPRARVALATRTGGGVFLAYCVPTKTGPCSHVNLWRAGAAKALQVPGSNTGKAVHVTMAAAPGGYLWIAWFDTGLRNLRVIRTTASANGFGPLRTISGPPAMKSFFGLQSEASQGPVALIALLNRTVPHSTAAYWATEVRP